MAVIFGNNRSNFLVGTNYPDLIKGFGADDTLIGRASGDRLVGGAGSDFLNGENGPDVLLGGYGNDALYGASGQDALYGGVGRDTLDGGAAADLLTGGAGSDVFQYRSVADSRASTGIDLITDFSSAQNDKLDIHRIDGPGASFIGNSAFTGVAGQVRYGFAGGDTFVSGDRNGDGVADYTIELAGIHNLHAKDFKL